MKTKRFFQISLAVAATAMLAACSPTQNPNVPGTTGELTASRTEIYPGQCTEFSCAYTPSKDVDIKTSMFRSKIASKKTGKEIEHDLTYDSSKGKLSISYLSLNPGENTVTFMIHEVYNDKSHQQKNVSMTVNVNPGPTDFRNCMWGSSFNYTLQNTYNDFPESRDIYGDSIIVTKEYNSYEEGSQGGGYRFVQFYCPNNSLTLIAYDLPLNEVGPKSYFQNLYWNMEQIEKDYKFAPTTYNYSIPEGKSLTAEEEAVAKAFATGNYKMLEGAALLHKAICEGRVVLTGRSNAATTQLYLKISHYDKVAQPKTKVNFGAKR